MTPLNSGVVVYFIGAFLAINFCLLPAMSGPLALAFVFGFFFHVGVLFPTIPPFGFSMLVSPPVPLSRNLHPFTTAWVLVGRGGTAFRCRDPPPLALQLCFCVPLTHMRPRFKDFSPAFTLFFPQRQFCFIGLCSLSVPPHGCRDSGTIVEGLFLNMGPFSFSLGSATTSFLMVLFGALVS